MKKFVDSLNRTKYPEKMIISDGGITLYRDIVINKKEEEKVIKNGRIGTFLGYTFNDLPKK